MMIILILIFLILLYLALCVAIPPVIGKSRYRKAQDTQQISDSTRQAGERVRCLETNQEALIWWLRVITAAEHTLVMSNHDFRTDNSGKDLLASLLYAADRGVKVSLLVDGLMNGTQMKWNVYFRALASHPNVEIKIYNQVRLVCFWRMNYRMHDKYIIADDHLYILGGRNANDLFLGNYQTRQNIDRDILVYETMPDGRTSLKELRAYFEKIWQQPCCRLFLSGRNGKKIQRAAEELRRRYQDLELRYWISGECHWKELTRPAERISLLANPAENHNKAPVLWNTLCAQMQTGSDVRIQTPYLICSKNMYQDLRNLTAKVVRIRVLTNAVSNGANYFGCSDYLNQKRKILQTGVTVSEYSGRHSLHTKTILIDRRICISGSFNVDMRSAYLDTELMLLIESLELVKQLEEIAEEIEKSSRTYPHSVHTDVEEHEALS